MSVATRIADRYAKSLIDLAAERGALEDVTADIRHFVDTLANRDLQLLLASPIVSTDRKLKILDTLYEGFNPITAGFIRIVTQKRREEALPEIAQAFLAQYRKLKGISSVRISSAAALGESEIEHIKAKLIREGISTDQIELEQHVDPELIGGFVVEVGDLLYDASISKQLSDLRRQFKDNPFQKALR